MSDRSQPSVTGMPMEHGEHFSVLADKLRETAEALLAFCRKVSGEDPPEGEADGQNQDLKPGEYRQYYLPPYAIEEESEFLQRYEVKNMTTALDFIYNDLFTTAFLMKGYESGEETDGFKLCMIGEQLLRSLDMLSRAGSVLAEYRLVHTMRIPA